MSFFTVNDMGYWNKDHVSYWSELDNDDIIRLLVLGVAPIGGVGYPEKEGSLPFMLVERGGTKRYDGLFTLFDLYCQKQRPTIWNEFQTIQRKDEAKLQEIQKMNAVVSDAQ